MPYYKGRYSFTKTNRPFLVESEYLKSSKSQQMLAEWMKNTDFDSRPVIVKEEAENKELEEIVEHESEQFLDKNVVRKKILEKLGGRLTQFDRSRNNEYFLSNFFDPLEGNL